MTLPEFEHKFHYLFPHRSTIWWTFLLRSSCQSNTPTHPPLTMQDIPERSNQSSVYLLRRNDPRMTYVEMNLHQEPDDVTLAHAVENNLWMRHVTLRTKYAASRDWTHLLQALANHPRLTTVEVADDDGTDQSTATARQLRPFWKHLLGGADSQIRTLHLVGIKCLSYQSVID